MPINDEPNPTKLRPLLEEIGMTADGAPAPGKPGDRGAPGARGKAKSPRAARAPVLSDAQRRRLSMAAGLTMALAGVLAGSLIAWRSFRPIRVPDVARAPVPDTLGFALLDANFNRLPLEERMRLVLGLAERMRAMNAGDSALVAAFAAGIRGEARRQLEENVRRLGIDFMTSYAKQYADVPEQERATFIESAMLEWMKLGEQLAGIERDLTDEERLERAKAQSERDTRRARAARGQLTNEGATAFMQQMQSDVNQYASPNDRARTARFMRDMTRHLRGRDITTNQPARR
ncbi:MAG: hypothetical protein EA379_05390 [Phycisphaerales bacterium]|nr:MAG: hypothetical protein EA379_05390 [Phycisphaerales bacterium]